MKPTISVVSHGCSLKRKTHLKLSTNLILIPSDPLDCSRLVVNNVLLQFVLFDDVGNLTER